MTLFERLYDDMKQAMKARDSVRVEVLRMMIAACKYYRIEKYGNDGHELSDEEVITVLNKQIKQRKESQASYIAAGRSDFADKEHHEATVIQNYVPPQMTEEELLRIIHETRASMHISTPTELGKLIGAVMAQVKGKADGSVVQQLIKREISL